MKNGDNWIIYIRIRAGLCATVYVTCATSALDIAESENKTWQRLRVSAQTSHDCPNFRARWLWGPKKEDPVFRLCPQVSGGIPVSFLSLTHQCSLLDDGEEEACKVALPIRNARSSIFSLVKYGYRQQAGYGRCCFHCLWYHIYFFSGSYDLKEAVQFAYNVNLDVHKNHGADSDSEGGE